MYMIENFGGWIINTRRGLVFGITVLALFVLVMWRTFAGSSVVISSREFECVMAVPDGLGTKCVEYHAKRLK